MKRYSQKSGYSSLAELNVTPLLDLAFVLLIIFMITAPALEQIVPLNPPDMQAAERTLGREQIDLVEIDREGNVSWNGQQVTLAQLEPIVLSAASESPQKPVGIRADGALAYQKVVDVIAILEKSGIKRFGLWTRVKDPENSARP